MSISRCSEGRSEFTSNTKIWYMFALRTHNCPDLVAVHCDKCWHSSCIPGVCTVMCQLNIMEIEFPLVCFTKFLISLFLCEFSNFPVDVCLKTSSFFFWKKSGLCLSFLAIAIGNVSNQPFLYLRPKCTPIFPSKNVNIWDHWIGYMAHFESSFMCSMRLHVQSHIFVYE